MYRARYTANPAVYSAVGSTDLTPGGEEHLIAEIPAKVGSAGSKRVGSEEAMRDIGEQKIPVRGHAV